MDCQLLQGAFPSVQFNKFSGVASASGVGFDIGKIASGVLHASAISFTISSENAPATPDVPN